MEDGRKKNQADGSPIGGSEKAEMTVSAHPLWQMGHCLASNRSGETRNILLHWMHTRWMTGLMTAPGWIGLCRPP